MEYNIDLYDTLHTVFSHPYIQPKLQGYMTKEDVLESKQVNVSKFRYGLISIDDDVPEMMNRYMQNIRTYIYGQNFPQKIKMLDTLESLGCFSIDRIDIIFQDCEDDLNYFDEWLINEHDFYKVEFEKIQEPHRAQIDYWLIVHGYNTKLDYQEYLDRFKSMRVANKMFN